MASGLKTTSSPAAHGYSQPRQNPQGLCHGRAKAIQAEAFLNLSTTGEGAELSRDHHLIVIDHNRIDQVGDKRDSEAETCQAVEQTFEDLELLRMPVKITTGKLNFGLVQLEPVEAKKRLPIQLRVALYAKDDDVLLCEPRTLRLNPTASDPREREQQVTLVLSNAADNYNNKLLELRFEQLLEGVATTVPYKTVELKLQRPFGSDFDDF
jgi:hypothetical protein